jgi:hypothetical protein
LEINRNLLNNGDLVLPRKELPVPELRLLFKGQAENEVPTLTIRAITGRELFQAQAAVTANALRLKLMEALVAASDDKKTGEAMAAILNDRDQDTDDFRQRLVIFRCGVIGPDSAQLFSEIETARIAEYWPLVFIRVSTEIMALSQEGPKVGE